MKRHMALGDFLVAYLRKIGVDHIFGIPGDLALKLFFALGRKHGMKIVTLSHEPGVGFAADGYARASGKIGVACVTYGAGGHNMVNPVAGSFSERVPILIFSGGPGEEERKLGTLIHHQAREIESQHRIYQEVTCASRVLTDPRRAAQDLHDVVRAIWAEQRPGYIEIHRDMVDQLIEVPDALIEWDGHLHFRESDARKVEEAARETAAMFNESRHPIAIAGIEIHRYKASHELVELAEKMGAPVCTTVLGKGAFPMDHPLYMGVHVGPISPPPIVARMDAADFVLNLGCLKTDMNFGNRPPRVIQGRSVWAVDRRVDVKYHTYIDVGVRDFVRALLKQDLKRYQEDVAYADNLNDVPARDGSQIRVGQILLAVNQFLAEHRRYMVVAESGDMLFGGLDVRVPHHGTYLAQGFYASMGFAVPAAIGGQIASRLRPLILCGDGGFQMTGPEISHAPLLGLNPIVLVINNGGWGIFRPIVKRRELLDIPPWPYANLARDWGGAGFEVRTLAQLRRALVAAHKSRAFAIIDVRVGRDDLSPVTVKYIKAAARRSQAPRRRSTRRGSSR
ncbi:MAG TPA: thiamine pyrophosphate-binding protein [Candidatus Binataceae bacterium]|nr:thiamine pyrophosphate-binding protein [Candidatus Binataceae bacterium]